MKFKIGDKVQFTEEAKLRFGWDCNEVYKIINISRHPVYKHTLVQINDDGYYPFDKSWIRLADTELFKQKLNKLLTDV